MTSRASAASSVSPSSTAPPGRLHSPLDGSCARLTRRTRSAVENDGPDTHDRARRILSRIGHRSRPEMPMTLTTTRFLRLPSNSA